jgi:putative oxygen-independent coproporphyrinogen III oxidase
MLTLPPLALYIHIPWCVRKCPYCDFNSHTTDSLPEPLYVSRLLQDLDADLLFVQGRSLQSIFFGGGTPSLFSADAIQSILQGVQQRIPFCPDIEITLEANPGTAEVHKFQGFRAAGVNRLSIGVQSFQPDHLQHLGRIHDARQAVIAVELAQAAGFERINIDLMHGLPEQDSPAALADLEQAIALGIHHISWYQLTIEPNTAFHRQPPPLPSDDALDGIQQAGFKRLAQAGLTQYEVSAFAKTPDDHCRHNLNYWQFGDYLGIGAGAHSKITRPDESRILRMRKTRLPRHYLERTQGWNVETHVLTPAELPSDFLLNALRLNDGVPAPLFETRTGLPHARLEPAYSQLVQRGLLAADPDRMTTTPLGFRFLNDVLMAFL